MSKKTWCVPNAARNLNHAEVESVTGGAAIGRTLAPMNIGALTGIAHWMRPMPAIEDTILPFTFPELPEDQSVKPGSEPDHVNILREPIKPSVVSMPGAMAESPLSIDDDLNFNVRSGITAADAAGGGGGD